MRQYNAYARNAKMFLAHEDTISRALMSAGYFDGFREPDRADVALDRYLDRFYGHPVATRAGLYAPEDN